MNGERVVQQEPVALRWLKATRCDANDCVEVALLERGVAVRDNTRPATHLTFDSDSWQTLLMKARSGELRH